MNDQITNQTDGKKYKLEECLNKLTYNEYRFARQVLPKIIGKCHNTLNNYINIALNSKEEIPYTIGIKMERFFGLEAGKLSNTEIDNVYYADLFSDWMNKKG
ncbi:MAG: hypothetical protein V4687_14300 [Bacteroidota bacterium]